MKSVVWLFDLDNTLHRADSHVFAHLSQTMSRYIAELLGVDEHTASLVRHGYWRRYGATLLGLMRHHGVDPHHFLRETHRFPDLASMVIREPLLRHVLRRLPGRKFVFSNAPAQYASEVLKLLRVSDLFEGVFAIEHTRFNPKPSMKGFMRLIKEHRLPARRCVMVEDNLGNLRTAKRLGMKTVWVHRSHKAPRFVDVNIKHVARLPHYLRQLTHP
ncbi:MAG: pyrimidine 5'-nucleotidase [Betaproteobacteria bacterium]|nr:pyrimidine 5'-nucleotidase [Betaproteobacteria bacterium]